MNKTIRKILIWLFSIISIGVICYIGFIALLVHQLSSFGNGCGMDDGPFHAITIDPVEISAIAEKFDLSDNGKLILENRADSLSPTLTLIEDDKVIWTLDTDPQNTEGYETTSFWKISNVTISSDTDPIRMNFTGYWTYGGEAGSMEIDRETGENSFCLSW